MAKSMLIYHLNIGMMDIFMTHVSRLDTSKAMIDLKSISFEEKLNYSQHERDLEDMDALKRSYHAMEFLSGTTANHLWVQNTKLDNIGKRVIYAKMYFTKKKNLI
jgi:hypothetical protein